MHLCSVLITSNLINFQVIKSVFEPHLSRFFSNVTYTHTYMLVTSIHSHMHACMLTVTHTNINCKLTLPHYYDRLSQNLSQHIHCEYDACHSKQPRYQKNSSSSLPFSNQNSGEQKKLATHLKLASTRH